MSPTATSTPATCCRLARAKGARIVHAHDVWRAEYRRFIARHFALPYVVHVRGPLSARDIKNIACTSPIPSSRSLSAMSTIWSGPVSSSSRIELIDDAVNLDLFAPAHADASYIRRNFGIDGSLLVGLVSRLSPFKRVCEFLDIIHALPLEVDNFVHFVVVGEWDNADYQRQVESAVIRLQLELRVHFIGRCPSRLMPSVLSGLDVLVTLSGGSTMFEAMAMGKAVLSIRSDGRHSQHTRHGHTAWCVDGDDPAAAAEALAPPAQGRSHATQPWSCRPRLGDAETVEVRPWSPRRRVSTRGWRDSPSLASRAGG